MKRTPNKPQLADLLLAAKTGAAQKAILAAFKLGKDAERALPEALKIIAR